MRRNIYIDKETEQVYQSLRPALSLSLLVREVLTNHDLQCRPVRLVRVTPPSPSPYPEAVTLDDQVVLNQTTILYEPTIADMDRLGATSVRLEWYDNETERWIKNK